MTTCVGILAVDRGGETLNGAKKQFAILLCRFLQVDDESFDLIGHQVERIAKVAEFCAARDCDSFRKITRSNAMCTTGEFAYRMCELVCEEQPDQCGQQSRDQADPECLPAHVRD